MSQCGVFYYFSPIPNLPYSHRRFSVYFLQSSVYLKVNISISVNCTSMCFTTRDDSDDEEAFITSPLAHSTPAHSDIHLETILSPSGPVCLKKKALLIGIQYYYSTNAQLDYGKDTLDTPAGEQLRGPHADVQNMRQLLLGKDFRRYHSHGFLRLDRFCARLLWLRSRRYHCAY